MRSRSLLPLRHRTAAPRRRTGGLLGSLVLAGLLGLGAAGPAAGAGVIPSIAVAPATSPSHDCGGLAADQPQACVASILAGALPQAQRGDIANDPSAIGDAATRLARTYLGRPYRWGGAEPDGGFDCSGLVQWVYARQLIALPRTAQAQYDATERIATAALRPGDLLFFAATYPDPNDRVTHVGIYIGDGQMLHAPREGDVVKIVPTFTEYWSAHYAGAGRVVRSR